MWTYTQVNGRIRRNGITGFGYAGNGVGKNNPAMQNVIDVGPVPCGMYTIQPPVNTDKHGPYVLWLEPDPANEMFGRADFGIHGDNIERPGTASDGCIIMPRFVREYIWNSSDNRLAVISGL
jgi:hypothetical protein